MAETFSVIFELDVGSLDRICADYLARGGDLRPVVESSRSILKTAVDDIFNTEGSASASGATWKASRRAEEQGGMTLQDTGLLAGTLDTEAGEDWVLVGSNVPYGKYHLPPEKSGHEITTGIMPVRDWLDIDEDEVFEEIGDLMLDHLVS